MEQLRSEVAVVDREYAASKEAKQLCVEFEKCDVELKQCSRLIRGRRSNPLGSFKSRDLVKMFVSHGSRARDAISHGVILAYFRQSMISHCYFWEFCCQRGSTVCECLSTCVFVRLHNCPCVQIVPGAGGLVATQIQADNVNVSFVCKKSFLFKCDHACLGGNNNRRCT